MIIFGHTHKPWSEIVEGVSLVNAGSVGHPKDGDPRSCYVTIDSDDLSISWERIHDVGGAARGIRESTLPDEFAVDLETGMRAATSVTS